MCIFSLILASGVFIVAISVAGRACGIPSALLRLIPHMCV